MTSPAASLPALRRRPLIVVANRGPYDLSTGEDGAISARRSQSGGVVTALEAMTRLAAQSNPAQPPVWLSVAGKESERAFARANGIDTSVARVAIPGDQLRVNYISAPDAVYNDYYNQLANPLLWFVQHGIWNAPATMPEFDRKAWEAYRTVNQAVAARVVELAQSNRNAVVSLQDYHFYLAADLIRQRMPRLQLQQFIHIPWPEPRQWQLLPREITREIVSGLLGNDILGMQTKADVENFRELCRDLGYNITPGGDILAGGRRKVAVRDYPIGIDVAGYTEKLQHFYTWKHYVTLSNWLGADTSEVRQYHMWQPYLAAGKHLQPRTSGDPLVTMMGRIDPSKNLVGGLLAFERLLEGLKRESGPQRLRMYLFGQETRGDIPEYQRYARTTMMNVGRINNRFENVNGYGHVRYHIGHDVYLALALYMLADITVIPSLADGMNLMALESRAFGSSALLLSRSAGAFQSVGRWSFPVDPNNVDEMAAQMRTAYATSPAMRAEMAWAGRNHVLRNGLDRWVTQQMRDIGTLSESQRGLG